MSPITAHTKVLPCAPDAWYDPGSVRVGYEVSFTRYFYKPQPLRSLAEIPNGPIFWRWSRKRKGRWMSLNINTERCESFQLRTI